MYDLMIIGGGAAGLMAAVSAKEENPSLSVAVLEKADRVGKKIAVSGNGQCNITNRFAEQNDYHGDADFAARVLSAFPPQDQIAYFESIGLPLTVKEDGKAYPHALQAAGVVDALRFRAEELGVQTVLGALVTSIKKDRDFVIGTEEGDTFSAHALLLACGGEAGGKLGSRDGYRLIKSLGHTVTPCHPAIVPLKSNLPFLRAVKGIKVTASVSAEGVIATGDLLFCDYGVSGPTVLFLSSYRTPGQSFSLTADLVPDMSADQTLAFLTNKCRLAPLRTAEELLAGLLHKKLGLMLAKQVGIEPTASLSSLTEKQLTALNDMLHHLVIPITDACPLSEAQVTHGGAETTEFDSATMMSRKVSGLFGAGEVLNVDGNCGGYNLCFAWASGRLAAKSAVRYLEETR